MVQIKKGTAKKPQTGIVFTGRLIFSVVKEVHEKLAPVVSSAKELHISLDGIEGIDLAGYQLLLSLSRTVKKHDIPCTVDFGSSSERLLKMSEFSGLPKPFDSLKGMNV